MKHCAFIVSANTHLLFCNNFHPYISIASNCKLSPQKHQTFWKNQNENMFIRNQIEILVPKIELTDSRSMAIVLIVRLDINRSLWRENKLKFDTMHTSIDLLLLIWIETLKGCLCCISTKLNRLFCFFFSLCIFSQENCKLFTTTIFFNSLAEKSFCEHKFIFSRMYNDSERREYKVIPKYQDTGPRVPKYLWKVHRVYVRSTWITPNFLSFVVWARMENNQRNSGVSVFGYRKSDRQLLKGKSGNPNPVVWEGPQIKGGIARIFVFKLSNPNLFTLHTLVGSAESFSEFNLPELLCRSADLSIPKEKLCHHLNSFGSMLIFCYIRVNLPMYGTVCHTLYWYAS